MPICAACGQENPEGFRFCGACAAPLAETSAPREQRKRVTVLFCDVAGSTALGEQLDPEALRRVMRRYFDEIAAVVERHGGTVEKFIGDAVMAVFGIPQVREDDALRAVRAAAEIRERLPAVGADLGVELSFRTGVNTGDVVVGSGQTLATGDAVNVAARLEQAAPPGEILLGAETRRLVRDAVEVEAVEPLALKGKSEPVAAYRLLSIDPNAAAVARNLDAPLVGRERELDLLRAAFERSLDERSCHLFTLLGPAGVGKSRLVAEFLGALAGPCHGGAWPLPALRRRHHVLAARGDARAARRRRGSDTRARDRGRNGLAGGPLLGGAPATRARGDRTAARRRVRRPALGRADAARPPRSRRRPVARLPARAALPRAPGAARQPPRLGRWQAARDDRPARAASGGRLRAPARRPRRRPRSRDSRASRSRPPRATRSFSRRWPPSRARGATRPSRRRSRRCSPPGSSSYPARNAP